MNDRLKSAWKKAWTKTEAAQWEFGLLGRHNADGSVTFSVPGRAGYLFVTMRTASGAQTAVPARVEVAIPHAADLPVRMKREAGTYVIYGRSTREDLAVTDPPDPSGVPAHTHDDRYFRENEHISASAGAADASKPIVLDAGGKLDNSLIDSEDIADIVGTMVAGNTETDIAVTYDDADNTLDFVLSSTLVGDRIHAATGKTTPVDADEVGLSDSAASWVLKKLTWANIKATLLTYFSTLYVLLAGKAGGQVVSGGTDSGDDLTLQSTSHATKGNTNFAAHSTFDEANGRWGFGTLLPAVLAHVFGTGNIVVRVESDGGIADIELRSYRTSAATHGRFLARAARGSMATPVALESGDEMFGIGAAGYGGVFGSGGAFGTANTLITVVATEAFTGTNQGVALNFYVVPLGATVRERAMRIDPAGNVGIGIALPLARLNVLELTLGSVVQRLQSTATNDDVTQDVMQGRIATTDATVTTLQTIAIPASHTCMLEVAVVARRTGGASGTAEDGAGYILRGAFKNVAGTATIIGAVAQTVIGEDQAGWDATLDVNAGDARIRVTGAASNTITWHCTTRHWFLST